MCAEDRRTLFGCSKVFGIRHGALLAGHTLRRRTDFPAWPWVLGCRSARRKKYFFFLHMFLHYVQQVIGNLRGLCCLLSFVRGHRFASLFLLLLVLPFVGNLLYGCDVKMRVAAASSLFAGARFCKAVAVSAP